VIFEAMLVATVPVLLLAVEAALMICVPPTVMPETEVLPEPETTTVAVATAAPTR